MINRKMRRRAGWWAVAAAVLGMVAQASAQPALPTDANQALPTRPTSWPSFTPPSDAASGSATLPSLDSLKPTTFSATPQANSTLASRATTSQNLPPFAGLGAAQPASGQTVTSMGAILPTGAALPDRSPREFGNGWKNFINQQMRNRGGIPGNHAAMLAAPRSASAGPRPDWNWYGYDGYNMGQPRTSPGLETSNAGDLAPFMKYAHLWRPAGRAIPNALPAANPATRAPNLTPASFDQVSSMPPVGDATSHWSGYGKISEPNPPKPLPPLDSAAGASPGGVQFHAAPIESSMSSPTAKLPPLTPLPVQPKTSGPLSINYAVAPAEGNNRIPAQIREKISQICDGKCRNLVVESISPIRLRISFLVKEQSEADMLTNLLGSAAELAPYKVDFEVQIGQ